MKTSHCRPARKLTRTAICSYNEQQFSIESFASRSLSTRLRVFAGLQSVGRLPEGMGGLAKGLAIIEAFSPRRNRLTVSEAAEASHTSRASARRCLLTLTELGYLEFDGKYFRPQPRLLALSAAYSGTRSLPQIAQPFLQAARDELQESISLAVLDRDAALFVARPEAERLVTTGLSIGTRIDL